MTTFLDGPAKGQHLALKRTPVFLRVVERHGKFDALDQLNDRPRQDEMLHAYRVCGKPTMCHINAKGGRGGFQVLADYAIIKEQPSDEVMRNELQWTGWVIKTAKSEGLI